MQTGLAPEAVLRPKARRQNLIFRFARRYPLGAFGAAVLLVFALAAIFADQLAPHDPVANNFAVMFRPPGPEYPLGTDNFGRDVLSRIIFGARTALLVAFTSSFVGATLGALLGVISAHFGGWVDDLIQRITDIILAFPLIILALAMVAALGTGTLNVIIAITIPMIPRVSRVIRASALALREMPFVEAARALGASDARIIFIHLLPNVVAPYLVMLTAFLGQAILLEASLSFLGLGVAEPTPAWGLMLRGAATQFAERAPWLALAPGMAISLGVFAFNLLGDALRDALDPRLRV